MTDTPKLVDSELARITAQMDQDDAVQREQDGWLARRHKTLIAAGMAPEAAASIVSEYQAHLWGATACWCEED